MAFRDHTARRAQKIPRMVLDVWRKFPAYTSETRIKDKGRETKSETHQTLRHTGRSMHPVGCWYQLRRSCHAASATLRKRGYRLECYCAKRDCDRGCSTDSEIPAVDNARSCCDLRRCY